MNLLPWQIPMLTSYTVVQDNKHNIIGCNVCRIPARYRSWLCSILPNVLHFTAGTCRQCRLTVPDQLIKPKRYFCRPSRRIPLNDVICTFVYNVWFFYKNNDVSSFAITGIERVQCSRIFWYRLDRTERTSQLQQKRLATASTIQSFLAGVNNSILRCCLEGHLGWSSWAYRLQTQPTLGSRWWRPCLRQLRDHFQKGFATLFQGTAESSWCTTTKSGLWLQIPALSCPFCRCQLQENQDSSTPLARSTSPFQLKILNSYAKTGRWCPQMNAKYSEKKIRRRRRRRRKKKEK